MNTKWLLTVSAIVLALFGVAGSFLPHELLAAFRAPSVGVLPVLIQLLGALYIGFAMANWTSRESLFGGIYNRPLALGNLVHFVAGAFALAKAAIGDDAGAPTIVLAIVYGLFAIAFAMAFFRSPVSRPSVAKMEPRSQYEH